jgi:hypothetical protein
MKTGETKSLPFNAPLDVQIPSHMEEVTEGLRSAPTHMTRRVIPCTLYGYTTMRTTAERLQHNLERTKK